MTIQTAAIFVLLILLGYSGWVSVLVFRRTDLETTQKALQIALVWLLPLIGTVVIHLLTRAQKEKPSAVKSARIDSQEDQGITPGTIRSSVNDQSDSN
jgi:membrane-anchored protein YejM (alkaline phosphatase superfamily)